MKKANAELVEAEETYSKVSQRIAVFKRDLATAVTADQKKVATKALADYEKDNASVPKELAESNKKVAAAKAALLKVAAAEAAKPQVAEGFTVHEAEVNLEHALDDEKRLQKQLKSFENTLSNSTGDQAQTTLKRKVADTELEVELNDFRIAKLTAQLKDAKATDKAKKLEENAKLEKELADKEVPGWFKG